MALRALAPGAPLPLDRAGLPLPLRALAPRPGAPLPRLPGPPPPLAAGPPPPLAAALPSRRVLLPWGARLPWARTPPLPPPACSSDESGAGRPCRLRCVVAHCASRSSRPYFFFVVKAVLFWTLFQALPLST